MRDEHLRTWLEGDFRAALADRRRLAEAAAVGRQARRCRAKRHQALADAIGFFVGELIEPGKFRQE